MATNYPTSLDDSTSLPNPTTTTAMNVVSHAGQHDNENDAIKAIEAKVGTGASTATANTVLRGTGAGTTAFGAVNLTTDVTGSLSVANGGTGSTTQNFVDLTTAQTVAGVKTFSSAPIVPASSFPESAVTNLTTDLAAKATDTAVVHLAGAETISGAKTFSSTITGSITGNAATVTTNANLTGDITSVGNATTYNNTVPIAKGGTGSTTQNFVDLTTNQTVAGNKNLTGATTVNDIIFSQLGLTKWRAAMRKVITNTGSANLVLYGDSITQGYTDGNGSWANESTNAIPARLRNLFNQTFAPAGDGINWLFSSSITYSDTRIVNTGATYANVGAFGMNGLTVTGTAQNFKFTPTNAGDTFVIYYTTGPAQGSFTAQALSGTQTINTNNATAGVGSFTMTANSSYGTDTVTITGTAGNTATILAIEFKATTQLYSGVRVSFCAGQGRQAGDLSGTATSLQAAFDMVSPDLSVINFGANEYALQTPVATFKTNMQTLITRALQTGDCVIVATVPQQASLAIPLSSYTQALYQLAATNNIQVIDLQRRWQSFTSANALGFYANGIHPSNNGYYDIANFYFDTLTDFLFYNGMQSSATKSPLVGQTLTSPVIKNALGPVGINTQSPSYGLHQVGGQYRLQATTTPAAPTVTVAGTAGTTSYSYYLVGTDSAGNDTLPSAVTTITTGNATLSATNYNAITWAPQTGIVSWKVLKGTTATSVATGITANAFNDIGGATAAYTPATRNASADAVIDGNLTTAQVNPTGVNFSQTYAVDKIAFFGNLGANNWGISQMGSSLFMHSDTSGGDIQFGYGYSGNVNQTMIIKGTGNVGIGSGTTPGAKLDIGTNADVGTTPPLRLIGYSNTTPLFEAGDGTGAVYFRVSRSSTNVISITSSSTLQLPSSKLTGTMTASQYAQTYRTVTSAFGFDNTTGILGVDATAGAFNVTLPDATNAQYAGVVLTIKKLDSSANNVTLVTSPNTQTIDGVTTKVISGQYTVVRVACNGANWLIV